MANFTIQDLKSVQICPDLSYFKKTRELETSLERTFYHNLLQEIDDTLLRDNNIDDKSVLSIESMNNSVEMLDEMNENMSMISQHSSNESPIGVKYEDNLNYKNMLNISNEIPNHLAGLSYVEGFSCIKTDDIKEYLTNFGDGNKEIFKNVPQYQKFTKSFNQLDKTNPFLKTGLKEETKRVKKEEKLFNFSQENEVKPNEVFAKDSKIKSTIGNNKDFIRKDKKKKVRQFYNYDKTM